ncbi:hypothetical protein EVAR_87568_1 [Eumeta japonica]|uniref:Uncharacterized protein n=1 Tax=Eumeta variegata TaxID=151549 RepID=A0A4C1WMD0_EUMVA|nr:hypothetical protein EVAR_87568_1 [Eumeta japonica]
MSLSSATARLRLDRSCLALSVELGVRQHIFKQPGDFGFFGTADFSNPVRKAAKKFDLIFLPIEPKSWAHIALNEHSLCVSPDHPPSILLNASPRASNAKATVRDSFGFLNAAYAQLNSSNSPAVCKVSSNA